MSHSRNYIIAGGCGKDPANLSVNMEPVKLSEDMAIAVKSISYSEIWNVNGPKVSLQTFRHIAQDQPVLTR